LGGELDGKRGEHIRANHGTSKLGRDPNHRKSRPEKLRNRRSGTEGGTTTLLGLLPYLTKKWYHSGKGGKTKRGKCQERPREVLKYKDKTEPPKGQKI